jgi:hypothetical protein
MNATLVASLPKDVQSLKIVTMYETPRECRISLRFLHSAFAFCAHEWWARRLAFRPGAPGTECAMRTLLSAAGIDPEAVTDRVVEPRAVMKGYLQREQFHTVYNRDCAASWNDLMIIDNNLRLQGEF